MENDSYHKDNRPLFSLTVSEFKELLEELSKQNNLPTIAPVEEPRDIVNVDEFAQIFNFKKGMIYQLTYKKQIPYRKIAGKNYFSVKDVKAHWEQQKIGVVKYVDLTITMTNQFLIEIVD